MIHADSTLVTLRRARLVLFVTFPLLVVFLLWYLYNTLLQLSPPAALLPSTLLTMVSLLLDLAICGGALVLLVPQGQFWQRIEQRRLAAARGDQRLLATEQPLPAPDITFLRPPFSIGVPFRRGALPAWLALLPMVGFMLSSLLSSIPSPTFFHRLTPAGWLIYLFAGLLLLTAIVLLVVTFYRLYTQQLYATEEGLSLRSLGQTHGVPWHEARLFARYEAFGVQRRRAAVTYELSSATDIVRWTWTRRRTSTTSTVLNNPQNEEARRESALLSLIAANTGLPLYDLGRNHE